MSTHQTIKILVFTLLCAVSTTSLAQYSEEYGYDEDDYDGDYEYNSYNNNNYQRYSEDEYRKRQERFYKKSYEEEDLYNGGYRSKNHSSIESYYGVGGLNMGGISTKTNSWIGIGNTEVTEKAKPRNIFGFDNKEAGLIDGIDRIADDAKGGVSLNTDPNKGIGEIDPGDKKTESAPPPLDEPDIPIDTAIPYLIAVGIWISRKMLGRMDKNKFYNKK